MPAGFELCEEVVATADGWESRACAWAPTRAAWQVNPRDNQRHALTGRTTADRAFAEDAARTLGDILYKYLVARYGPPGRRVPGPACPPAEAVTATDNARANRGGPA